MWEKGLGTTRNKNESYLNFKKATELGDNYSCFILGTFLEVL